MELTFCGAARAVTGSCIHLRLKTQQKAYQLLVDCGLQQGPDVIDNGTFPFQPQQLNAVLLTHCHIDHCGRLPLLIQQGFRGPIFMTEPTAQLLQMLLRQRIASQQHNRQLHKQKKSPATQPLFTAREVEQTLSQVRPCPYQTQQQLADNIAFCFYNAGHILGSASIALYYQEQHQPRTLLFSGDLGNRDLPLIADPRQASATADYVVLESTHSDHCYLPQGDDTQALARILESAFQKNGTVLIPAAAVGRTQALLYQLQQIKHKGQTPSLPDFPVYVDSPLAQQACALYSSCQFDRYLDSEALALKRQEGALLQFSNLHFCTAHTPSEQCNRNALSRSDAKVLLAAGSSCDSEPICRYFKQYLPQPECIVVLPDNPRKGTTARKLLEGAKEITLLDEKIAVQARIATLPIRPIHADQPALCRWLQQLHPKPQQVFLNHGDEETALFFAAALQQAGYSVQAPHYGETFLLQ